MRSCCNECFSVFYVTVILDVLGAVRRNKLLKGATNAEIETVVKLWLRYTCDRSGGRQHRYEKQSQRVQTYSDMESD